MTQLVKLPTLGFSSSSDLRVMRSSLWLAQRESTWVSLSLSLGPPSYFLTSLMSSQNIFPSLLKRKDNLKSKVSWGISQGICMSSQYISLFFKILFISERETESKNKWGRVRGRGRSRLPTEQGAQCRARSQDPENKT